ncbi:hypothetical protein GCM10027051_02130 [Niabella terrae]
MKAICIWILFVVIFTGPAAAQQDENPLLHRKNAGFVHLMGPTIIYSLGYERALMAQGKHGLVINGGGMIWREATGFHGGLSYLYFLKRHALEAGMNVAYVTDKEEWVDSEGLIPVPNIGYRYYTKNEKLFLKAGADFFLGPSTPNDVFPYPYLGIGFRF